MCVACPQVRSQVFSEPASDEPVEQVILNKTGYKTVVGQVFLDSGCAAPGGERLLVLSQISWSTRRHHLIVGDTLTLIAAPAP